MNSEEIAHLAGVFDAIGTATVHITKRDGYRTGYEFRPLVRLRRGSDDEALIGKLDAYAERQGVKPVIQDQPGGYEFEVYGPDDIAAFLEPLMPYLVTDYQPSHILLHDILPAVRQGDHLTKEGFYELMGDVDRLRDVTKRGPDSKYTQEFFEKEWAADLNPTA